MSRQVRFKLPPSFSRKAVPDEEGLCFRFADHTTNCHTCAYAIFWKDCSHLEYEDLCDHGRRLSQDVVDHLYCYRGHVFSMLEKNMRVELPPGLQCIAPLLEVMKEQRLPRTTVQRPRGDSEHHDTYQSQTVSRFPKHPSHDRPANSRSRSYPSLTASRTLSYPSHEPEHHLRSQSCPPVPEIHTPRPGGYRTWQESTQPESYTPTKGYISSSHMTASHHRSRPTIRQGHQQADI